MLRPRDVLLFLAWFVAGAAGMVWLMGALT